MTTDALTTITKIINSPPGVLVAGGVLAGIVWKFFERVEAVLNENTKLEIAVWLLGRKRFGPKVQPWPETLDYIFDRLFGTKYFSWKCFSRSCVGSYISVGLFLLAAVVVGLEPLQKLGVVNGHDFRISQPIAFIAVIYGAVLNIFPDYIALLETRFVLRRLKSVRSSLGTLIWLLSDFYITSVIATMASIVGLEVLAFVEARRQIGPTAHLYINTFDDLLFAVFASFHPFRRYRLSVVLWYLPAFWTSIWLWLYAGAGFLLKAARRFDIGFNWFNRHFDIEKKPLQSIGLVAGALVAVVYWTAVIVSRVVG
jgi:hypothetical protein